MEFDLLIFGVLTAGAVLIVGHLVRLARTAMLHRTIRKAIANDIDVLPSLLNRIEDKPASRGDDRTGLILLALALATLLFGLVHGDAERARSMAAISLYPALVGGALLSRSIWMRRRGPD